ncbi:hypothetical protein LVX13_37540 [Streptomyces albulus]|nr:hypothetical protein [Streptomyces noursei]
MADVAGGVTKDSKRQADSTYPDVPYLRVANVQREHLDLEQLAVIRVKPEQAERYRLQPGDVLMTEGGDRDKLGRGWVWEGQIHGCIHQNHVFRARIRSSAVAPTLLARYVNSLARPWLEANATQSVNLASISISKIKQLPVPVPPSAEQLRILAALEGRLARLDVSAKQLNSVLADLDRLAAAVLDGVATGTLLGSGANPPTNVLVESVAEVSGGIQKQGRRRPQDNPYPFLRVANVGRGELDLTDVHQIELFGDEIERYRLSKGDLLVVEGNGSPDQIGRAALWEGQIEDCVHQNHLIRVRVGDQLDPAYLELVWNSPTMGRRLRDVAISSTGLYTLSTRKVKNLCVPLVPLVQQRALVTGARQSLSALNRARQAAVSGLSDIAALRRALLQEAFIGKLVSQNPDDEPAEELLKRIRIEREAAEAERKAARRTAHAGQGKEGQPQRGIKAKQRKASSTSRSTQPPPPHRDAPALDGEQTALPLEFSS